MKVILFANTDWYLYNFRQALAVALRRHGVDVLLVAPPGQYGERLQALGLRWIPAPLHRRSLGPLREIRLLLWLLRLFRRERPDIVHGFTIKCAVYASIAARWSGVPACVGAITGMGYVFTSRDARASVLRPFVRLLLRHALVGRHRRLVLQNADDVNLFVRARLARREDIRLIPSSGVDVKRFVPLPHDVNVSARPLCVVLAARLLWDKGIAEYIEAARQLRAQNRRIRFLLAGAPDPGNPASVDIAAVERWLDQGLVEWLGHVDDMAAVFEQADVAVLPSYREGLPKSLIEAAASALALVTTDVPGCRDVVHDGIDGLLVPARNAAALATAIARLDDDRSLLRRLGDAARANVLATYDVRIVNARTLDVYRELVPDFPLAPSQAEAEAGTHEAATGHPSF
ncbi:MAG TPA: glycosyltransferase family 4 protein [Tahibacter sp.]|uniref:glycosyltransferase family 4 protein n=1 Tax=Tahibacter sp. TaxID=2056211 RepID=UPI002C6ADC8E|nr:glycosyltransferase family 4 protein [Tahibacter sp.]HSX59227.1 glycosyltransferase family 4 protein [Tahibacter sp.]